MFHLASLLIIFQDPQITTINPWAKLRVLNAGIVVVYFTISEVDTSTFESHTYLGVNIPPLNVEMLRHIKMRAFYWNGGINIPQFQRKELILND